MIKFAIPGRRGAKYNARYNAVVDAYYYLAVLAADASMNGRRTRARALARRTRQLIDAFGDRKPFSNKAGVR